MASATSGSNPASAPKPWWRYGMVWMVIGGPAVVVVAGFVTFYLAVSAPDPVLPTYGKSSAEPKGITHAPALQGRNHAATGELPAAARTDAEQAAPAPAASR